MKKAFKQLLCLLLIFTCVVFVSSCQYFPVTNPDLNYKPEEGEKPGEEEKPGEDKVDLKEKYNAISVSEAIALAQSTSADGEVARVYGIIKKTPGATYGDTYLTDGTNDFYIYGIEGYSDLAKKPAIGDEIVLEGVVKMYKETPEMVKGTILEFITGEKPEIDLPDPSIELTVSEALEIANKVGEAGTPTPYKVKGTVKNVTKYEFGEMYITDGINDLYVYGITGYQQMEGEAKPVQGYEVVLEGILKTFKDSPEMGTANLISYVVKKPEINEDDYKVVTIQEARDAEDGTLVKLTGVVAQITYANGLIPNGVMLVDETNSIYVYSRDVAGLVQVGNTITIAGAKTYYVLETEQDNANKYGYKGSNQIENPILLENDNKVSEFPKEWITEYTVKDIMDTPWSEDITTTIFKVNALVKKVQGTGFVNYYIDDLDGVTGSYIYTQANGSDFAWLDAFDGKICTVYLTVQNAKSSASGCVWRFLPIEVIDEGFKFDSNKAAEFAIKYYAKDQFLAEYDANPGLVVATSVSSELLGFADVKVTYASSNKEVVYFEETADGLVFNTKKAGTAVVTIEASYNGVVATETVEITVVEAQEYETITVKEAIESEDGTVVFLQGIVVSSVVNQAGFYLSDGTGIIAVITDEASVAVLEIGQEVVVTGTKTHRKDPAKDGGIGQINIDGATILINHYGKHEVVYPNVIEDVSIDALYSLDAFEDHSTEVYKITGVLNFTGSGYSTGVNITDTKTGTFLSAYCSGSGQYSCFQAYNGQEVTAYVAMCNWNNKKYYRMCILAIEVEGNTIYNTSKFTE